MADLDKLEVFESFWFSLWRRSWNEMVVCVNGHLIGNDASDGIVLWLSCRLSERNKLLIDKLF